MCDLILVPTPLELQQLQCLVDHTAAGHPPALAIQQCGFGLVAAAARSAALIARYRPTRVLLVGIAGSFDVDRLPVGTAWRFDAVHCDGVGVGVGMSHRRASELGWVQFSAADAEPQIGDTIALASGYVDGIPAAGSLLSVAAGSADPDQAGWRRQRFPDAVAEDMEGFAVATACQLAGVPLQIVRGISNAVGDRDRTGWQINRSLAAAGRLAVELLTRSWIPSPE